MGTIVRTGVTTGREVAARATGADSPAAVGTLHSGTNVAVFVGSVASSPAERFSCRFLRISSCAGRTPPQRLSAAQLSDTLDSNTVDTKEA